MTSVIITLLNENLKLNFLIVYTRHKTVGYALRVTYGVSGALEKRELELNSIPTIWNSDFNVRLNDVLLF